jgi:hypothetical protein
MLTFAFSPGKSRFPDATFNAQKCEKRGDFSERKIAGKTDTHGHR